MRRSYLVTGALLLLLAVGVGVEALRLQYYTRLGPGPGFFAFWLAVCLGICALAMVADAWWKAQPPLPQDFLPSRAGLLKIGAVALSMVATIFLLEPLGFRLTTLLVYLLLLWALGQRSLIVTPLVALGGSFGVYHVFVNWLDVPLPVGALGI